MSKERFHIGQSASGTDRMGPHEATVTWIGDSGHESTADLGEAELEEMIAKRKASGGGPTVFIEALAALRGYPTRRP